MLPKINRIKKNKDFGRIFKRTQGAPQSLKNNLFIVKIIKNNLGVNRFGFVVSQKVSKKAVVRNKVKRRLSEAVRDEKNKIITGIDLVIIALPGIEKRGFSEIKEAVRASLAMAKIVTLK